MKVYIQKKKRANAQGWVYIVLNKSINNPTKLRFATFERRTDSNDNTDWLLWCCNQEDKARHFKTFDELKESLVNDIIYMVKMKEDIDVDTVEFVGLNKVVE